MERASKVNLQARVVILGNLVGEFGAFYLDHDASGYRLERRKEKGGTRYVSPRLSGRDMMRYLDGMIVGVEESSRTEN